MDGKLKARGPRGVVLDCDEGRRRGCASYCCRLIVRLSPGDVYPDPNAPPGKRCVDKDPDDGLCVFMDKENHLCTVWERRPSTCRAFDCNNDPLLQVVLEEGFVSLTRLVTAPRRPGRKHAVPYVEPE